MWPKNKKYSWSKAYDEIKTCHDKAFNAIDQAISLEEHEKPTEAIKKYKEGIHLIDEALSVQVQCPEYTDETWEKAGGMIKKIKRTRAEVLLRINSIQSSSNFQQAVQEDPPSYEEAISSSDDEPPRTYMDLATALNELNANQNQGLQEDVIYNYEGVRLYFISPNGEVLSTQEPEVLKISLVQGTDPDAPRAILQIGNFVYPLVPAVSPCYRTNYGAFILPNLNAEVPGSSIGIILPSDADDEVFDLLESILYGIISQPSGEAIAKWRYRRETEEESEDYSTRISDKIVNGAWLLSQGIIRGAMKAGEYFNTTTPKIINSIESAEHPKNIPQPLTKTMEIAESTTSKAVQVTGFVADKIGTATIRLGKYLAPHIQKQGTKLLTNGFNMPEKEASNKMKSILTVAAGAVEGFSTVYRGLETSASILGNSLKENTVKIVGHKYGQPASTLTDSTLSTVGNVYNIAQNAKIMTPKGLARRTAKDTGRAMVYEYSSSSRGKKAYEKMIQNGDNGASCSASNINVVEDEEKKVNSEKKL